MVVSPGIAIIKRELLTGLRSGKPFLFLAVLMLIMIGGLVFMLGVVFPDVARVWGRPVGAQEVRSLFMVYAFGLYLSAVLLVPPLAGVSICAEKQQDSYDLLLMTYIRPRALALAKLLNVLGLYTLVVIATLPVAGVFFFLVGLDWTQFVQSMAVIAGATLSCAAIGLLCSAWFYRTLPAIITTYVIGFAFHGGLLILTIFLIETVLDHTWFDDVIDAIGDEYLIAFCPMLTLGMIGDSYKAASNTNTSLLVQGCVVILAFGLTLLLLHRPPRGMKVYEEKPIDDQAELKARRRKFPFYLLDPRRRRAAIPDHRNPLLSKELQTSLLGRGSFAVRIFYGFTLFCFVVSFFSIVSGGYYSDDLGLYVAWPLFIETQFILVVIPALVATAMAKEHEWGNLDMLRMTLLSPKEIVAGKFRTALYTAALPVGGAMLGALPMLLLTYHIGEAWLGFLSGFSSLVVCVLYALCLTLCATVRCKRSIAGLMMGYIVGVGALVLLPAALFVLWMIVARNSTMPEVVAGAILFTSPLSAQLFNLEEFRGNPIAGSYWFFNCLVFTGVSFALVFLAKLRFLRYLRWGTG